MACKLLLYIWYLKLAKTCLQKLFLISSWIVPSYNEIIPIPLEVSQGSPLLMDDLTFVTILNAVCKFVVARLLYIIPFAYLPALPEIPWLEVSTIRQILFNLSILILPIEEMLSILFSHTSTLTNCRTVFMGSGVISYPSTQRVS